MRLKKPLLSVNNLVFARDHEIVLDNISFELQSGDILQIQGANGSGKTTLLRLLTTALKPTSGDIFYSGELISQCRFTYLSRILFLGHQTGVKLSLSVAQNLAWMSGQKSPTIGFLQALTEAKLSDFADVPCQRLSAGQRRRVALAQLLLSDADIWYLDEPYTALDKEGVEMVNQCMDSHCKRGGAVILSTHQKVTADSVRTFSLTTPTLGVNI